MEQTKLTIRLPRDLVEGAKLYAKKHQTSLTRLISAYLRQLDSQEDPLADAPAVRRMSGILPLDASVDDYHAYLEDKYGPQSKSTD
jgi:hypothetical protein